MIIILKNNPDKDQLENLEYWLSGMGIKVHPTVGTGKTILGLVGDTSRVDIDLISALDIVEDVKRVQEPFKNVNRKFHPDDTVIDVGGVKIGGGTLTIIAGPCSVESEEQVVGIAKSVKESGATILRGGAFKPRSSPYSFQGLGIEGIRILLAAKEATGLPVVSEIMDASQAAGRLGDNGCVAAAAICRHRHSPGRRAEHAELLPPEGPRQAGQAHPPEAWALLDLRRVAHERRIHSRGRERQGHPVRARHPDIRDLHPEHAGRLVRACPPPADPPANHH